MGLLANLTLVFVAGLITALATGIGAVPFFLVDDVSDRWNVGLWGLASGIMLAASGFGLINEGIAEAGGLTGKLVLGLLAGVALVIVADRVLSYVDVGEEADHEQVADGGHGHGHDHGHDHHVDPEALAKGDLKKMVLILGILTVHSFPEGVAVGVSFAELGLAGGLSLFGFSVPLLAVFMTIAISIHNIPEGLAISIPLRSLDVSEWRMVGLAIFSSLPQPLGAVIAFYFVRIARAWLPFGFGFAAGAMVYLVLTEFVPEALESGEHLDRNGYPELAGGLLAGVVVMVPLVMV
ncbi:MAG: ZIP family metal transporter [Halosimplex sp.]